jgi:hypothetical protein
MIAPENTGLETDQKPWLIPDDAFAELNNAYVFRSRVRKRFGSQLMGTGWSTIETAHLFSRLRVQVGTVGAPDADVPTKVLTIGQLFSIGTSIFTVYQLIGVTYSTDPVATCTLGALGTFTFANTGAFAAGTAIYWYPALPVMGLTNYELGRITNQPSFAFDTKFAYTFSGGSWFRSATANAPIFHGSDSNFFWTTNWRGVAAPNDFQSVMFVSNYYVVNYNGAVDATNDDTMWAYSLALGWQKFTPKFKVAGAGDYIKTARIIVAFKGHLLLLSTVEVDAGVTVNKTYPQRCRYSFYGSPFDATAWLEKNEGGHGGSGYVDAYSEEQIISAEFIKDRLIVYFERSTFELAYTGNQILPFVWQKINSELGSEAMLSSVPFDKVILTVGTTGIHACNASNVERIDTKLPDTVFRIRNTNNGIDRVAGIRDYFTEMVYWTFPVSDAESTANIFPTKVFLYNYKNNSWAFNDDCITAWGYFEQQTGKTWANSLESWQTSTSTWASGTLQANFRQVIAGNQQGFVFIIDSEESRNAPVMQLTNINGKILTIINHSLQQGDYILIENCVGAVNLNGTIVQVLGALSVDSVAIWETFVGTYTGGGTITRVSKIEIKSKQWNPYVETDKNVYLAKVDFLVDKTNTGQVEVQIYPSSSTINITADGAANGSLVGTGTLETSPYTPLEATQERIWHMMYLQAEGHGVQLLITMNDIQMKTPNIVLQDFVMHALTLYTRATGSPLG